MASFNLNKSLLAGRVTKDPELQMTKNGTAFVKTVLAVNKITKNEKEAEFFAVSMWGNAAENFCKFCKKGTLIYVEGAIHNSMYEKDGIKHYTTEIVAQNVVYIDKAEDKEEKAAWYEEQEKVPNSINMTAETKAYMNANLQPMDDAELPF